jgi:hypothetical protein
MAIYSKLPNVEDLTYMPDGHLAHCWPPPVEVMAGHGLFHYERLADGQKKLGQMVGFQ